MIHSHARWQVFCDNAINKFSRCVGHAILNRVQYGRFAFGKERKAVAVQLDVSVMRTFLSMRADDQTATGLQESV